MKNNKLNKNISVILSAVILAFAVHITGCEFNDDNQSGRNDMDNGGNLEKALIGTWRLLAFVDADGEQRIALPDTSTCPKCYTFTFEKGHKISGRTSVNDVSSSYTIEENNILTFSLWGTTEVGPTFSDDIELMNILRDYKHFQCKTEGKEMSLYYDNGKSLLFKRKTDTP